MGMSGRLCFTRVCSPSDRASSPHPSAHLEIGHREGWTWHGALLPTTNLCEPLERRSARRVPAPLLAGMAVLQALGRYMQQVRRVHHGDHFVLDALAFQIPTLRLVHRSMSFGAHTPEQRQRDRDLRETIAQLARSNSESSRALVDQLRQVQIDTAKDKLDTSRNERGRTQSIAATQTRTALNTVDRMLGTDAEGQPVPNSVAGGLDAATGAYELRGFTQAAQDFNAERARLVALLAQPNLGALKGPMSDKDIIFVQNMATTLANPKMSAENTRQALIQAREFLRGRLADDTSTPAGNRTGKIEVTAPNGKTYAFDTAEQTAAFKKRAGMQ